MNVLLTHKIIFLIVFFNCYLFVRGLTYNSNFIDIKISAECYGVLVSRLSHISYRVIIKLAC